MQIRQFLQEKIGLSQYSNTLQALDKLAGRTIGTLWIDVIFYQNLDEVIENTYSWMPIYFLPIANDDTHPIGLHLHPDHIKHNRLPIMRAEENYGGSPRLIEIADSLEAYLYRALLHWEGLFYEEGEDTEELADAVILLSEIVGNDFYQIGEEDEFSTDEVGEIMIANQKGSVYDYYRLAFSTPTAPENQKMWLNKGLQKTPLAMSLYYMFAKIEHKQNNLNGAAQQFIQALTCHHHTYYGADIDMFFKLGKELLEKVPDQFNQTSKDYLAHVGEAVERFKWIVAHFERGEIEESAKLINDLCFAYRNYENAVILNFLKTHYQQLGWTWAEQLCDWRLAGVKTTEQATTSTDQYEAWAKIVKERFNL